MFLKHLQIKLILKKAEDERTEEEKALLDASQDVVAEFARRARQRQHVKRKMEEVIISVVIFMVSTDLIIKWQGDWFTTYFSTCVWTGVYLFCFFV